MKLFAKYFKDNSHWIIILFLASAIIAIRFIFRGHLQTSVA